MLSKLYIWAYKLLAANKKIMYFYYQHLWRPSFPSLKDLLYCYSKSHHSVFFIQVGANDGLMQDPLYRFVLRGGWKGIVLEPQETTFHKLQSNYRPFPDVIPENKAISDQSGKRKLWKIAFSDQRWATGKATFVKSVLEKEIESGHIAQCAHDAHITPPKEKADWLTYETVDCITFDDLLNKHQVQHIDLLQIDTEGFDYEIIKLFNFERIKPALIGFEHHHLSTEDRQACYSTLRKQGYLLFTDKHDTVAFYADSSLKKYEQLAQKNSKKNSSYATQS